MKVVNPITSGGLSSALLALATATAEDVVSGKTFYSGDKSLKTGTLVKSTAKYAEGILSVRDNSSYTVTLDFKPSIVIVFLVANNIETVAFVKTPYSGIYADAPTSGAGTCYIDDTRGPTIMETGFSFSTYHGYRTAYYYAAA